MQPAPSDMWPLCNTFMIPLINFSCFPLYLFFNSLVMKTFTLLGGMTAPSLLDPEVCI